MLEWARHGAKEFDWILAERQTGGRGRHGRVWQSPPGNLYASTLIRLRENDPPAPTLAFVAGLAACQAVKSLLNDLSSKPKFEVMIKWPNDILVDGAKIAGILLEREGQAVVLGFGINIASKPEDLDRPVACIADFRDIVGEARNMLVLLNWPLNVFFQNWRRGHHGGFENIRSEWLARAHPIGTAISVQVSEDQKIDGLFDGLDDVGALRLRLADGEVRVIQAGDVFLL